MSIHLDFFKKSIWFVESFYYRILLKSIYINILTGEIFVYKNQKK